MLVPGCREALVGEFLRPRDFELPMLGCWSANSRNTWVAASLYSAPLPFPRATRAHTHTDTGTPGVGMESAASKGGACWRSQGFLSGVQCPQRGAAPQIQEPPLDLGLGDGLVNMSAIPYNFY